MICDHSKAGWNGLGTDERCRLGDHVTIAFPTEYARAGTTALLGTFPCGGMERCGSLVTTLNSTPTRDGTAWSQVRMVWSQLVTAWNRAA